MDYTTITNEQVEELKKLSSVVKGPTTHIEIKIKTDENNKIIPYSGIMYGKLDLFWKDLNKRKSKEWVENFDNMIKGFGIGQKLYDVFSLDEYFEVAKKHISPFWNIDSGQIDFCLNQREKQSISNKKLLFWGALWSLLGSVLVTIFFKYLIK